MSKQSIMKQRMNKHGMTHGMKKNSMTQQALMNSASLVSITSKTALKTALLSAVIGLSACQTFSGDGNTKSAVETASNSEAGYYQDALAQIDKANYIQAIENLESLRVFYPTGQYAEQALLDLIYAQFMKGEHEAAVSSAEKFIRLYPNNPQADYAYYVRGVANMEGPDQGIELVEVDQSARDTTYYRVAFANFVELINRYPNSPYAPDAAKRMTYIYNKLAASEIHVAKWYIKRKAYIAAANRAKWVFQYFPRSESVPESAAILTYSYEQLGLTDMANQYREVLKLNYPDWLTSGGRVKFVNRKSSLMNTVSFGRLGKANTPKATASVESSTANTDFVDATKSQSIREAAQLDLPSEPKPRKATTMTLTGSKPAVNFGLGLPESEAETTTSGSSVSQAASDGLNQLDRLSNSGFNTSDQPSITLPSAETIAEQENAEKNQQSGESLD